jgi:predicted nucleotidyltransferase
MARVRKPEPTLECLLFVTPEQKVLRLLLSEPTTSFTSRVISSKLKGVRGLGGGEGIQKILEMLGQLGFAVFLDNGRSVRLNDDHTSVQALKKITAICDLENLKEIIKAISKRGILVGSRASGTFTSDSDYDLVIVSSDSADVRRAVDGHPLGKLLDVTILLPEQYSELEAKNNELFRRIEAGIHLWGPAW